MQYIIIIVYWFDKKGLSNSANEDKKYTAVFRAKF